MGSLEFSGISFGSIYGIRVDVFQDSLVSYLVIFLHEFSSFISSEFSFFVHSNGFNCCLAYLRGLILIFYV